MTLSLLKDHKLTLLETLRKNKMEIPPELVNRRARNAFTSIFGFQKTRILVSYGPKKNRCLLLTSTMHHDNKIDATTGKEMKPEMITLYNATKGGVDLIDQMCATYDAARTRR
ncbi:uncharacterized protein LOC126184455 [Schistocerca cancellata]|uniref:uncharacterized protein LOC126184455 n=1 Tax=Schistocerca cancellata TaxID=274614 RepID=UPI0021177DFC|nr:uncharacterized protein LOC126184455 [Schistocerca cancellata]